MHQRDAEVSPDRFHTASLSRSSQAAEKWSSSSSNGSTRPLSSSLASASLPDFATEWSSISEPISDYRSSEEQPPPTKKWQSASKTSSQRPCIQGGDGGRGGAKPGTPLKSNYQTGSSKTPARSEATPEGAKSGILSCTSGRAKRATDSRAVTAAQKKKTEEDGSAAASEQNNFRLEKYFENRTHIIPDQKWDGWDEKFSALKPFYDASSSSRATPSSSPTRDVNAKDNSSSLLFCVTNADKQLSSTSISAAEAEGEIIMSQMDSFNEPMARKPEDQFLSESAKRLEEMCPPSPPRKQIIPQVPSAVIECASFKASPSRRAKQRGETRGETRNERNARAEAAAARHVEKMTEARERSKRKKEILYTSTAANLTETGSPLRKKPINWRKHHFIGGRYFDVNYDKSLRMNGSVLKQFALLQKHINAARIIQQAFRKFLINRFLKRNKAATLLQAVWRGRRQRRLEMQWHTAAGLIQMRWRHFVCTRVLMVRQQAAFFFRQAYVSYQCNAEREDAAIVLQAAWRSYKARRWPRLVAAAKLQKATEMIRLQTENAAVLLQSVWRGRKARQLYTLQTRAPRAAIVLQSAWRGRVARLRCTQLKERLDGAATTIQECWRAYAAKRLAVQNAAATLQAVWKGRSTRMQLKAKVKAAVVIQKAFKAKYGPILKERRAAVTVQAHWRGRCQRMQYNELRAATVVMQKATRGWLIRKGVNVARHANRFFAMALEDYSIQSKAATVFQKVWRGRRARIHVRYWNNVAAFLQTRTRLWLLAWHKLSEEEKAARRTRAVTDAAHGRKWRKQLAIQARISKRFPSMTSSVFARFDNVAKTLPYVVATVDTIKKVVPASKYVAKKTVAGYNVLKKDGPKKAARGAANAAGKSMLTAVRAGGEVLRKKIMLLAVPEKAAKTNEKKSNMWKVPSLRLRNEAVHADLEATTRTTADGSNGSSRPPGRPRRVQACIIPSNGFSVPAESVDDSLHDAIDVIDAIQDNVDVQAAAGSAPPSPSRDGVRARCQPWSANPLSHSPARNRWETSITAVIGNNTAQIFDNHTDV